ncbi:hypothetical protein Tco_0764755 [Tanacetum coccineum]
MRGGGSGECGEVAEEMRENEKSVWVKWGSEVAVGMGVVGVIGGGMERIGGVDEMAGVVGRVECGVDGRRGGGSRKYWEAEGEGKELYEKWGGGDGGAKKT